MLEALKEERTGAVLDWMLTMRGTLCSRAVRQMVIVLTIVPISCGGDRTREALREAAAAGTALDQRLPALTIERLHEGPAELVDLLGSRLTVINFWGTWCKPCEREMPHLVALQDNWGEHGVRVLGVTIRSYDQKAIEEWIEHFGIQFPTLIGKSFDWMSTEFGIAPALPRTLLVDSESRRIVHLWTGARSQEDLERGLRLYWREIWGDLPETPSSRTSSAIRSAQERLDRERGTLPSHGDVGTR